MVEPSPSKKTVLDKYVDQQKLQKSPNKDKQTQCDAAVGETGYMVQNLKTCCYICFYHMIKLLNYKGEDSTFEDIAPEWDHWIQRGQ